MVSSISLIGKEHMNTIIAKIRERSKTKRNEWFFWKYTDQMLHNRSYSFADNRNQNKTFNVHWEILLFFFVVHFRIVKYVQEVSYNVRYVFKNPVLHKTNTVYVGLARSNKKKFSPITSLKNVNNEFIWRRQSRVYEHFFTNGKDKTHFVHFNKQGE